jgi:nicotinamidase-related amidase
MSPIASDHDFEARVAETGVVVILDACADVQLDWNDVDALSRRFESFGSGG